MKNFSCNTTVLLKLTVVIGISAIILGLILQVYYPAEMRINFVKPLLQSFQKPKLFTAEEIRDFKGLNEDNDYKVYLSILGKVYDVTKGAKHYGPGAPYHVFTGRDVSRAFVTGDFVEEKLTDAVLDLPFSDLRSLRDWSKFYETQYDFQGKLVGKFYNEDGKPTPYLIALDERFKEADLIDGKLVRMKQMFPPCNVEWDSEQGTRVWCTKKSGGIVRNWIGVPRKLFEPNAKGARCACVSDEHLTQGNIEEYKNCASDSISCYVTNSDK